MKIITKLNILALTISILSAPLLLQAAPRGQLSAADYKFVSDAARNSMAEAMAADLVRHRASDPSVKELAERVLATHTQASNELQQLAKDKGAILPAHINSQQQRRQEHLQTLSGAELDKAYLAALKASPKASEKVRDVAVKTFADKTAATNDQHLQQSKTLVVTPDKAETRE